MDPLLYRCCVRFRALKDLRRTHESLVPPRRLVGSTLSQHHGAKLSPPLRSFSRFSPSRSLPLNYGKVNLEDLREPRAEAYNGQHSVRSKSFHPFRRNPVQEQIVFRSLKAGHAYSYIRIGQSKFHPAFLRDACTCIKCVDPSSRQKTFQSPDIPVNIIGNASRSSEGAVEIVWENDIPGFGPGHKSIFPQQFFADHISTYTLHRSRFDNRQWRCWNQQIIARQLKYVNYNDYMNTDEGLFRALRQLMSHGLLLVREVPHYENAVEDMALRIGNLRDTFYGRTWDVKSVPQAKNVAYTAQYLGLHMDLLYMSDPPGFQFLHCLQNTCEGGSSLFSDGFYAACQLSSESFFSLTRDKIAYHYRNAGEYYYFEHPLIQIRPTGFKLASKAYIKRNLQFINYSPPFQADHIVTGQAHPDRFPELLSAMREFAQIAESEENLYEHRLREGECVIFNNRRVLHGRRQFDTTTGSRWLKGAYVDTNVFMSRYRVLSEKFADSNLAKTPFGEGDLVNPKASQVSDGEDD